MHVIKKKKIFMSILATVMALSLLSGCGGKGEDSSASGGSGNAESTVNKEGYPIVDKPLTLSIMAPDMGIQNWKDMPVMQEMEKLTGIKIEYRNAPRDSFDTKKNLVFASGDYPDIFFAAKLTQAEEQTYGSQGILLPLEDLIDEYAPNIKKALEDNPDIRKSITAPDGHIYSLPRIEPYQPWYRNPMWYNGKILKELNVTKLPETTDELYDLLKLFKEKDSKNIPLSSSSGIKLRDIRTWILGAFGAYEEELYIDDNDVVHYTPAEDSYKGYITYLNKLWNEDLLDHESFSQTDDQKKAKIKNNQVLLFSDWHAYMSLGDQPSTEDPMFSPVKSNMVDQPAIARNKGFSTGTFAISRTNPSPEASIRWVDYMYSSEGQMMWNKGPEGTLWKYTDDSKQTIEYLPVPNGEDREDFRSKITPNFGIASPMIVPDEPVKDEFAKWVENESQTKLLNRGARVPFPALFLTEAESAEVTALRSDLSTYVAQMEAKFITGQESIDGWDKYVQTLKKMGSDRFQEIYQGAYDRWKNS
ncbi:extracellular solute-binding protein [Paenibacillus motobuensis]|uniref:extracellular solute-binding protein n=1 Tax=Paenibacillus TaxID=44249 RepID=UPI0020414B92|nr:MULTISPECIES: extracellular solute-binding protein [Paenibacillus]MCM3040762.1 extracellular solute-binding protein [Paenibacillus lutimineralis]MCM3647866.1 extracellular solute-binding protein [Paenibacillus motobuensis]